MNRVVLAFLGVLLTESLCFGQAATPAPAASPLGHGSFPVKVTKILDSSRLQDGDAIEVETTGSFKLADGMLVPKGSKVLGHVIAAKARSKGDQDSELTLAFDKLNITNSKQLSLKGFVQAVFPPAEEQMGPNMATAGTSQGGSMQGVSPAGIGLTNSKSGSDTQSSSTPQTVMNMKATGVQGIHDLQLEKGVLTSRGKNVKLTSGVRMVVQTEIYQ